MKLSSISCECTSSLGTTIESVTISVMCVFPRTNNAPYGLVQCPFSACLATLVQHVWWLERDGHGCVHAVDSADNIPGAKYGAGVTHWKIPLVAMSSTSIPKEQSLQAHTTVQI